MFELDVCLYHSHLSQASSSLRDYLTNRVKRKEDAKAKTKLEKEKKTES